MSLQRNDCSSNPLATHVSNRVKMSAKVKSSSSPTSFRAVPSSDSATLNSVTTPPVRSSRIDSAAWTNGPIV